MYRLIPLFVLIASGCGTTLFAPKIDLSGLSVVSQPGANRNTATALDIVLVYREELLAQLPDTSPEWFRQRAALEGKYRTQLEVIPLELPPGDRIEKLRLSRQQRRARAVILYANYLSANAQHPINITGFDAPRVLLGAERIEVSEPGEGGPRQ